MKFKCHAKSKTYIVHTRHVDIRAGQKFVSPGLRAKFENHRFDSEQAQEANGWTDETRKEVEMYLLKHKDLNRTLGADGVSVGPQVPLKEGQAPLKMTCVASGADGTGLCGAEVEDPDSDLCPEHLKQFAEMATG